jgi:Domain of unknown function (DUF4864)
MKFIDLLRKLGFLRGGFYKRTYTSAKDMPDEIFMDDVYDAKRDLTTKEDTKKVFRKGKEGAIAEEETPAEQDGPRNLYCEQCGNAITKGANFCGGCGAAVTEKPSTAVQQVQQAKAAPIRSKKKMGKGKKILLGIAVLIVLFVALALWTTEDLLVPIENQMTALRNNDIHTAYQQTSAAFRHATTPEAFARFVQAYPGLSNNKDADFSERTFENNLGYVKGSLTAMDGGVMPVEYQLVKENDQWKIQGINIPDVGP